MSEHVVSAPQSLLDPAHEFAIVTTSNGLKSLVHYEQSNMQEVESRLNQGGADALISLRDIETGDLFHFPGNVELLHTFSAARHDQMKADAQAEADAAQEEARRASREPAISRPGGSLIVPRSR